MKPAIQQALNKVMHNDPKLERSRDPARFKLLAQTFEQASGLYGIGKTYRLPEGQTPHSMDLALREAEVREAFLKGLCDAAEELPELTVENAHQLFLQRTPKEPIKIYPLEGALPDGRTVRQQRWVERNHASIAMALRDTLRHDPTLCVQDFKEAAQEATPMREVLNETFATLQRLNPEVDLPIDTTDTAQLNHVVDGILSGFNPVDVQFFALEGNRTGAMAQKPEYAARKQKVEYDAGAKMSWLPAPSTLLKAQMQLEQQKRLRER